MHVSEVSKIKKPQRLSSLRFSLIGCVYLNAIFGIHMIKPGTNVIMNNTIM